MLVLLHLHLVDGVAAVADACGAARPPAVFLDSELTFEAVVHFFDSELTFEAVDSCTFEATVARPSAEPFSSEPPSASTSSVPNSVQRPSPFARPSKPSSKLTSSSCPAPSPLLPKASIPMPLPMLMFFDLPFVRDSATSGNYLSLSVISGMPRISLYRLFRLAYAGRPCFRRSKIRSKKSQPFDTR